MGYQVSKVIGFKGYGGKIKENQTIRGNATEEIWEETGGDPKLRVNPEEEGGIHIREEWLEPVGLIDFYNGLENDVPFGNPSFRVYFFISRKSIGKAVDTIEMVDHQLFNRHCLPLNKMVKGDDLFIPKIVNGKFIKGWVRRDNNWNIIDSDLKEYNQEDLMF